MVAFDGGNWRQTVDGWRYLVARWLFALGHLLQRHQSGVDNGRVALSGSSQRRRLAQRGTRARRLTQSESASRQLVTVSGPELVGSYC